MRQRAIDNFTKTTASFIGRSRKRDLTVGALHALVAEHALLSRTEGCFSRSPSPSTPGTSSDSGVGSSRTSTASCGRQHAP